MKDYFFKVLLLLVGISLSAGFQPLLPTTSGIGQGTTHHQKQQNLYIPKQQFSSFSSSSSSRITSPSKSSRRYMCQLWGNFLGDFFKRFTTKATASHILIKGGAEAENKLEDLKVEIGNSPIKFAEAAAKYSECPSASSGGNLGEFGPGAMVKEFDQVVFSKDNAVGMVHGPVRTQFGYHLIYISDRSE